MRFVLALGAVIFLTFGFSTSQQAPVADSCRFTVSDSKTTPAVAGPDDVISRVQMIEQPDSPLEVLAMDFKDSFVSVVHERFSSRLHWIMKVRNRSDQPIRDFGVAVIVTRDVINEAGSGFVGVNGASQSLEPGQQAEIEVSGGHGSGSAPNNQVRILVYVSRVRMSGCLYSPSKRVPY